MKANKNFRMEDEAVSPVIGVILMVAITVVLAAVVFVLVSDLGDTKDAAPAVSFTKSGAVLKVISADTDADWQDIQMAVSGTGSSCAASASAGGSASAAGGAGRGASSTAPVTAGDTITMSGSGQCILTLSHVSTNSLIDDWTFNL